MTSNNNINITIIGGTRGLGKWIAHFLKKENFHVTITSRNKIQGQPVADKMEIDYSDDNIKAVENADIIIFSVPIDSMVKTIKQVAPYVPQGSVMIDVASIKTKPSEALKEYAKEGVEILPCHPMFGPRVPSLDGQVVILTPIDGKTNNWFEKIQSFLKNQSANVVISTPEEHDKMMSVVQGLTHFTYISIASTIRRLGISIKRSRDFASPIYSLMLDMISRIVSQNPYLYYSIQKENPNTVLSRNTLISEVNHLAYLIDNDQENEFVYKMSEAAKHLDEFEESLGRSDKAIETLSKDLKYLKSSIGKEVGLQHQYSGSIHVGIILDVDANNVTIRTINNKKITLKLANINILSKEEIFTWKCENLKIYTFDVSCILSDTCDENILLEMFRQIKPVIEVSIKEIYKGSQIEEGFMSITFHYNVFNKEDKDIVESYLEGIGGKIR